MIISRVGRPNSVYENLQTITWDLTEAISSSKNVYSEHLTNKLSYPNTSSKACWSIIKTLINCKNVLLIISSILVNNKLATNFKDKANIFNDFFSKQCQPIPNNSTLPSFQTFEISNRLSTLDIDSKKILKLIQGLNSNKAHGHDGISIRILKLCEPSKIKPFSLLFSNCLRDRVSPNDWK